MAGIGRKTSCHRKNLPKRCSVAKLYHSRLMHCSKHGHGLAPELSDADVHVGIDNERLEATKNCRLEFFDGPACCRHPADQWKSDFTVFLDAVAPVADLLNVPGPDRDLVADT